MAQQSDTAPLTRIDGSAFSEMSRAALEWLRTNKHIINTLNVFPIPDGDTGQNMLLTMQAACAELETVDVPSAAEAARLLAKGARLGGQGNSGIILSQIWTGLEHGLKDLDQFSTKEFAAAMRMATETAYLRVGEPVEGTILTIIKDAAEEAATAAEETDDMVAYFARVVRACERSVERTPALMPTLAQAGVVDAGGFGLLLIFEGMLRHLRGESLEDPTIDMSALMGLGVRFAEEQSARIASMTEANKSADVMRVLGDTLEGKPLLLEWHQKQKPRIASLMKDSRLSEPDAMLLEIEWRVKRLGLSLSEPGQEWEVVVDLRPHGDLDDRSLFSQLKKLGTSIQLSPGDDLWKVHIHLETQKRYEPIELAETLGTVVKIQMENLLDQINELGTQVEMSPVNVLPGQLVAVAVSPGPGLTNVMRMHDEGLSIVSGGQTMNPSVQDLLNAFEDLPVHEVIILPNNKNILLAAKQAAEMSVKEVRVIPTRSVPQGVAALLAFDPDGALDEVCASMHARAAEVESGEITTALDSVSLNGHNISKGQIIGMHNGEIACVGDTPSDCTLELLRIIGAAQCELVTLYYGEETDPAAAESLQAEIEACFSQAEVENYSGGQPHFHYILSVE